MTKTEIGKESKMTNDSLIIKALGVKSKKLSSYDVIREVENLFESWGSPLGAYHKELLHREWAGEYGRLPFEAYKWQGMDGTQKNFLWRLSVIPLGIWLLILFLNIPFMWIFLGRAYYKSDPKKRTVSGFTINWIDKCFDRR